MSGGSDGGQLADPVISGFVTASAILVANSQVILGVILGVTFGVTLGVSFGLTFGVFIRRYYMLLYPWLQ